MSRRYTLVYDGDCRVCTRLVNLLRAWDSRNDIEIVPSQAPGVLPRFPWIPARAFQDAIQLIGPGGATWQGASAIEELLGILPRGRWIAWIFRIPLVRSIADRAYRWFARNRYRMGCGQHCTSRPTNTAFPD
jgi:predicted DCC family thiol-disulfide oxidoreductase YuxK